jgi:Ser/Thr protein kinase RdoA (MazF antagonist)
MKFDIQYIAQQFDLQGDILGFRAFGSGHINDTFLIETSAQKYVIQRINHEVFKKPAAVMANIQLICEYQKNKLIKQKESINRQILQVVPTINSSYYYTDKSGNFWRTYIYVPDTVTFDIVENEKQAFQAGKGFGKFQRLLADLPPELLHETIPHFHHLSWRYEQLEKAIDHNTARRVDSVKPLISFALSRKAIAHQLDTYLSNGSLPLRATHNDTKINNVLMDKQTQEVVCVIDLDTAMAGAVIYDFGDLVRSSLSLSQEDEQDLSKIQLRMSIFKALSEGYLSETKHFITSSEKSLLVFGGKMITLIMGIRFLTDYLSGDVYYKIKYPTHNLDRCQTQFRLVELIESKEDEMNKIIAEIDIYTIEA